MSRIRPVAAAALAVAVASSTASCSGTVDVGVTPSPGPSAHAVCQRLLAALPAKVDGVAQRATDDPNTAAFGRPPITVACGVPEPSEVTSTSQCLEVNGVGWFAQQGQGGVLFSTLGRDVVVQVGVPQHYTPASDPLVDLAAAVQRTTRSVHPCQ